MNMPYPPVLDISLGYLVIGLFFSAQTLLKQEGVGISTTFNCLDYLKKLFYLLQWARCGTNNLFTKVRKDQNSPSKTP
jgi:hypothetical protein